MTVMMAPVAVPWARTFADLAVAGWRNRIGAMAAFGSGYFAAWLAYSVAAAAAQVALQRAGALDTGIALASVPGGAVLVVAGIVQATPLKQACLSHCRNPLTYFLARWENGPTGGFRLGLHHGLFCVGCCWALMATAFAVGVMNLLWMGVLTGIVAVEQLAPHGDRIGRMAGFALMGMGLVMILR